MARKSTISDVIDAIEEALDAAEDFAKQTEGDTDDVGKAAALTAISQIRRGDFAEAITTLEREFLPKWQSTEGCRAAYAKATGVDPVARDVGREIERAVA